MNDEQAVFVRAGESFKDMVAGEGWKNLSKYLELQLRLLATNMLNADMAKFSQMEHAETIGKSKMIGLVIDYVSRTIKESDKIKAKNEEVK